MDAPCIDNKGCFLFSLTCRVADVGYHDVNISIDGGGIAIYVHSQLISIELRPHPGGYSENIEIIWVRCEHGTKVYYIAACYHPPRPHYPDDLLKTELSRDLDTLLKSECSAGAVLVLAGDFNSLNTDFLIKEFGLSQIVQKPTHGKNILDKFFTSRPDLFDVDVFRSLVKTKHKAVFFLSVQSVYRPKVSVLKCFY